MAGRRPAFFCIHCGKSDNIHTTRRLSGRIPEFPDSYHLIPDSCPKWLPRARA